MNQQPELDITIPEVEIAKGWFVSELATVDDCDDALTYLTDAITSIRMQLSLDGVTQESRGALWRANTQSALTWKRHAREAVYRRRGQLRDRELKAMNYIRRQHPQVWKEAYGN